MDNKDRELSRYCRAVRSLLPCGSRQKKEIMNQLMSSIEGYMRQNRGASSGDVIRHFGSPESVAASCMESMGAAELLHIIARRRAAIKLTAALLAAMLVILVSSTAQVLFSDAKSERDYKVLTTDDLGPVYQVNANGETYGGIDRYLGPDNHVFPDLVATVGTNGEKGYVRESEMDGVQPNNPEEAVLYSKVNEAARAKAEAEGRAYVRYVPLYESDGVTIIGRVGRNCVADWREEYPKLVEEGYLT